MNGRPVIVVLGPGGADIASRIEGALPGSVLHGLAGRLGQAPVTFSDTGDHLRRLYLDGTPIIGICASAILIRALATLLDDKRGEPPVIAVAEDGSAVVPLLGGHRGGNDLARQVAGALGVEAAVTTAGDVRFGTALDAPPSGFRLANPDDARGFTADLLAGARVRLEGDAPFFSDSNLPLDDAGALTIRVTDRAVKGDAATLVYHPVRLAVGVGCERGAGAEEVKELIMGTLEGAGLAKGAVAALVSIDLKADEPALLDAARALDVDLKFFPAAALEVETPRLANPSRAVFEAVGCHGVAEAAALAAVGPGGELVVEKQKSARATCAVARAPAHIVEGDGRLAIIGIGPGQAAWRTPEADALIKAASDIVGYGLYIDLLGAAAAGKVRHEFALGEEETRVRAALDLAAAGRSVALVSSGDAGIYAMATLVFEMIDCAEQPVWDAVPVIVSPGISALQAAAARAGAPLGHDFCAISLSDLLTPWDVIERRVRAAAKGDFAIAFYNPVSKRRTGQLAAARDVLLGHRSPETPVVLARNLGRNTEKVEIVSLDDLDPADIDMLTIVLVGSSTTRIVAGADGRDWVYTPRGYGKSEGARERDNVAKATIVHFIGAGPGAADLITVRGRALIEAAPVCLYAGSLVPVEVVAFAPARARVIDTSSMTLDQIVVEMLAARDRGDDVARVHSGDPSLYGAVTEQMRRLDGLGIAYDVTPGVPAFAAAAAALGTELTLPGVSQTVILTRTAMKSSNMPPGEELETLAASGATLVLHLSVRNLKSVTNELIPHYGVGCPVAVVYRASWPDQKIVRGTLADIRQKTRAEKITRTALVVVGRVLGDKEFDDSSLYSAAHAHLLRPVRG